MNKYQRENQVSDQELKEIKQTEINRIFEKTKQSNHNRVLNPKLAFSFMMLIIVVIIAIIGLKEPSETVYPNNIQVTQLSHNTYHATSILNGETFHLYYQSHIVYQGDEVELNELFDYKMRYTYVPDEISSNIDIEFKIFQVDDYRYFVYSKALGEELFFEFDYFYGRSRSIGFGPNMDFEDFEKDIKALYQLIDQYPPVFIEFNPYGNPVYEINENVYEVENERLVSNYVYYVKNYYMHENMNEQPSREEDMTVFVENIIILDESNDILDNIVNTHSYDRIATLDEHKNHVDGSFTYIVKDVISQPSVLSLKLYDPLFGRFSYFYVGDNIYGYTFIELEKIDIDLSETAYVMYQYNYGPYDQDEDLSVTVNAFIYHNNLITKPYLYSSANKPSFRTMSIQFYNEFDELIYSYDMNQE